MELEEPNINNYSCLSHVITKFRQSFSWLWNRKRNYLNLI
jgi:hypothetical protein